MIYLLSLFLLCDPRSTAATGPYDNHQRCMDACMREGNNHNRCVFVCSTVYITEKK